jgi:peptide/nickel transport system substrate-binding protein
MKNIYEALVWRNENLQLEPGLALSWSPVDPLTWEFKLRPGVKFHDGSDFVADDVKASVDRVPGAGGPDGGASFFVKSIAEVVVVDPHTVRFKTKAPAPDLPFDLAGLFIVSHAARNAKVEDFNSGKAAIGTGPFKFVSWQPKGDLVLERFDGYWRGKAAYEKATFSEISDDAARVAALLSGRVDLINYVPPADVARLGGDKKVAVFQGASAYQFFLWPDLAETSPLVTDLEGKPLARNPLRDPRVRQALSLAIDRDVIAGQVMEGRATPARQLAPEGFFGTLPDAPALAFDLAKAKQLLAEAGYPQGFAIALHCTSDRLPNDGQVCSALGQMFAKAGIRTAVNATPKAVLFPAWVKRKYVLSMLGWGNLNGETGYTLGAIVHSNDGKQDLGSSNHTGYANPALDKVIEEAVQTADEARRKALLQQAMTLALADLPLIPIVTLATSWAGTAGKVSYVPRVDEDTLAYYVRPTN